MTQTTIVLNPKRTEYGAEDVGKKSMTLEHCLLMGQLADIAEDRFWSQANVVITIAAVTALIVLLQWALA